MTKNLNDTSTTPTPMDIKADVLDGYSQFDIGITPVVKPVGNAFGGDTPQEADGGFNPPQIQGFDDGGVGEITTLEDCESVSRLLWNTPGTLFGDHLIRSEEQINLFAKELYLYCSKNDIDPRDYMMDWMPLAAIGGSMALGMYRDNKAYKKERKESASFNKPAGSKKTFDTGKGVTDSGSNEEMTPIEMKENLNPASSSGGDDIPMEE